MLAKKKLVVLVQDKTQPWTIYYGLAVSIVFVHEIIGTSIFMQKKKKM